MARQKNPNGEGTYIKLKDGRVAWRQMVDGQVREISAKTPKALKEKVKKIADLPIIKEKYTVSEWFEKWIDVYIEPLKKQATFDQYDGIYRRYINPVIGKRKLSTIKSVDVQNVIAEMNKHGLSSCTMQHAKKVMNGAFKRAETEKIIVKNPVVDIEIPVKQAKPRKVLAIDEIKRLLDAMSHSRWIWSVRFLLVTGMRRGELLGLRWRDIDWINRRITVERSVSATGIGDTKNSREHYIPLSSKAVECLGGQKKMLEQEYNPSLYKDDLKKDPLVFPTEEGYTIKPNTYYHTLVRFGEKAGIKLHPHMFRHTFVYLTRKQINLKDLQNILGHSESTTTLDIYGDMINDSTDENIKQIDNVFKNVESGIEQIKEKENEKKVECKVIEFRRVK